jgi:hypothetical protein
MTDTLPPGMTAQFANAACGLASVVICALGNLSSGTTVVVEIRVLPTQLGTFTNRVDAFSGAPDPNLSNNAASESTTVASSLRSEADSAVPMTFVSNLESEGAENVLHGRVIVNGSVVAEITSGTSFQHRVSATAGESSFEARVESTADVSGYWIFDFSGSHSFEPGSIRVQTGRVISLASHKVVFSVARGTGPIQFTGTFQGPPSNLPQR